jgi:hypothetical protein
VTLDDDYDDDDDDDDDYDKMNATSILVIGVLRRMQAIISLCHSFRYLSVYILRFSCLPPPPASYPRQTKMEGYAFTTKELKPYSDEI